MDEAAVCASFRLLSSDRRQKEGPPPYINRVMGKKAYIPEQNANQIIDPTAIIKAEEIMSALDMQDTSFLIKMIMKPYASLSTSYERLIKKHMTYQ